MKDLEWEEVVALLTDAIVENGEEEGTQSVWDQPGDQGDARVAAEWFADWMQMKGLIL